MSEVTEVNGLVVIWMGSKSDLPTAEKACAQLKKLGVEYVVRVASAHKTPEKVLELAREYQARALKGEKIVFLAFVGLSNALSGVLAGKTSIPIISCPTTSEDVFSSLRMPLGIAHGVVLNPENAGVYAACVLACGDKALAKKILDYKKELADKVEEADLMLKK